MQKNPCIQLDGLGLHDIAWLMMNNIFEEYGEYRLYLPHCALVRCFETKSRTDIVSIMYGITGLKTTNFLYNPCELAFVVYCSDSLQEPRL